jgi:hypothetical protein
VPGWISGETNRSLPKFAAIAVDERRWIVMDVNVAENMADFINIYDQIKEYPSISL